MSTGQKTLVVVESPTKAKTIRKFLGKEYIVESCMGHIRDLPQSAKDIPEKYKKEAWSKLGVNVDKHFDPIYCIPKNKTKVVKTLKDKLKDADELILATDEDREGESISWHLLEVLKPKVPVKRMVFHEITKKAIQEAIDACRDIDFNLVRAQEARRILDRLVGYTISPLLWKKVAYGLSAGRVQSVAVRLIAEKEHDRLRFKVSRYGGMTAQLEKGKTSFESRLQVLDQRKIAIGKDFDGLTGKLAQGKDVLILDDARSEKLIEELKGKDWEVVQVEEKPVTRKPMPPFITSTLQQEANRKLGMSSREVMQVAQKLYEQGFITYMRTDSTFLSQQAVEAARNCILDKYGKEFLPEKPRSYAGKKVKGAQEAHEAIRPAGTEFVSPEDSGLSANLLKVYDLIWKRTVACQMENARQKQVHIKIEAGPALFAASGMTIEFPGFLRAYVEGHDDPEAALQDKEVQLPKMTQGDSVNCMDLKPTQHETKPPARYTEASLVQTMEKEGIGRPSTYAVVIGTIQDRGYVKKVGNALVPTFTAMIVSKLLTQHLSQYVDLGFTSGMEESLDTIAEGELDWEKYLRSIYFGKTGLKEQVENQEEKIEADEARAIELDGLKEFSFRVGRYGAYVCTQKDGEEVCASLPESQFPGDITKETANKLIEQKINGADALGTDPETGLPVYILTGRYGPYAQLGDSDGEREKPKRSSIPPSIDYEQITLEEALQLLSLPKKLGVHPELEKDVQVGLGRFGPFVVCNKDYRSIPKGESLFDMTFERALELLAQPKRGRGRAAPLKELGDHPEAGDPVNVMSGPYGPYIKCGKVNASLGEDEKPEDVTMERAVELLGDRVTKKKKKKKAKKAKKADSKTVKKVDSGVTTAKSKKAKKKKAAKKVAAKKVVRRSASSKQA